METLVQREFRQGEAQLDRLLAEAAPALAASSIKWTDNSVRSYDQKESYLCWRSCFERAWQLDLLIYQVRVWATCSQPVHAGDEPVVSIVQRAEVFRAGQLSSVDRRAEHQVSLSALTSAGLATVVLNEIRQGASLIGVAP
jgi:hypothetical protein